MRFFSLLMACLLAVPALASVDRDHETLDLFRHYLQNQETAETIVMRTFTSLGSFNDDVETIAGETNRLAQQFLLTEHQEEKIRFLQKLYNQTVWEHNRLSDLVRRRNIGMQTLLSLLWVAPATGGAKRFFKLSRPGTILTGAILSLAAVAAGSMTGVIYNFIVNQRNVKPVIFADNLLAIKDAINRRPVIPE